MSLLSGLLNHMPPPIAGADKPILASRTTDRACLVLVERPAQFIISPRTSAATATPEWRQARDQYINHVMTCRGCYAPTARYCLAGADLWATYDRTPMESNQ